MFCLSSICLTDIVDTLGEKNPIVEFAQSLRKECGNYCFNLDDSNCNPRKVVHSLNQYKNYKLSIWEMFLITCFLENNRYENINQKV